MRIVCWQTILMKYQALFFRKRGKLSQDLSSAAVVIDALRVKAPPTMTISNFVAFSKITNKTMDISADDSHEISYLIIFKNKKVFTKFVVCCIRDWHFKG